MYAKTLIRATQTRRFIITPQPTSGWEVREETDSVVTRRALYEDWHRVERARRNFEVEALSLHERGWVEDRPRRAGA